METIKYYSIKRLVNNMKKVVLILIAILLLTGCTVKNETYYENIANTVIGFFNNPEYDENKIADNDRDAVKKYWRTITHEGQIIDLNEYIYENLTSNEPEGECSIDYETLKVKFKESEDKYDALNPMYSTTCNGHYAIIYKTDVYPDYEYTKTNPVHNYILLSKHTKDNVKSYVYKSSYNGIGLKLNLHLSGKQITKIDTEYVNANDYIQN